MKGGRKGRKKRKNKTTLGQLTTVLLPLYLTKGNVCLGYFPSVFVFTFYCELLNKVPVLILKNSVLDFKARISPSEILRETKSPVPHSQTQILLLCGGSD